ncbi:MAG: insulinase family protein [Ignavibacteriae bacterium]|nr:insulinase family protein [Ignavibacteriota bacterium]
MRRCFLSTIPLLLFATVVAHSQELPTIPFEKYTLANGLDVILHVDKKIPAVGVCLWYHVGSKNEAPGRTGFAHLFEHMMFQGSKHVKGEYLALVSQAGGRANGSTTEDRTNYFETVPKEALEYALWLESDRMGFLLDAVTDEAFKNQQDVVKNEKRQGDNSPYSAVQYLVAEHFYPAGHPYAHTVIGSLEDLGAATLDDVKNFFRTWYTPNNCTLTLSGDFDVAEAKKLVQKYFGPIPAGPPLSRPRVSIPSFTTTKRIHATDRVPQARLYLRYPVPQMYAPEEAPLDMAAAALGSGKSSILYRALVRDQELASDVSVSNSASEICGEFAITVTARPGKSLDEIRAVVDRELAAFAQKGPDADDLAQERARVETRMIGGLERLGGFGGIGDRLCGYNTFVGDPDYFRKDLQRYRDVTPEAVKAAFTAWIAGKPRLEIEIVPETSGRPDTKDFDRSAPPAIAAVAPYAPPAVKTATLPNGLEIVVSERHDLPLVNAQLLIKSGNLLETADNAGETSMTAAMLDEGTAKRSALQIADDQARLGSRVSVGGGKQGSAVSLTSTKAKLDATFDIMADIVLNPAFPKDEFERQRKLAIDAVKRQKSNPGAVADRVFSRILFGATHPLGIPDEGTESSLAALKLENLTKNYQTYWKPDNAVLIFTGDVSLDEATALAKKWLGSWKKGAAPAKVMPAAKEPSEHVVYLVDRPGAPQSQIRIGALAPPRSTPDYHALLAMNNLLGGTFASRVNLNLREDKGYTYGARSGMSNQRAYGVWTASAGVHTRFTKESLVEFRKEIEGIAGPIPVTPEEAEGTKNILTRSFSQNFESNSGVLGQLSQLVTLGLPFDEAGKFVPAIAAQTPSTMTQAAKKHLDFNRAITVVVGDLDKIEAGVRSLNWGKVVIVNENGEPVR